MEIISRLWRVTRSSEAVRQSAVTFLGTGITGAIMAVAMILASRVLGPERFGVFSVAIALMMIFTKGTDLGLNQLFPRLLNMWQSHPAEQDNFLAQMVRWRSILSVATFGFGLLSIPWLVDVLQFPYVELLVLAIAGAVLEGWYEHVYLLLSAAHRFTSLAAMSVLQAVLKFFGFLFAFIVASGSVFFLAFIYFVMPAVSMVVITHWINFSWWRSSAPALPAVQRAIRRFWPHAAVGSLAITLINNIDVLFVQSSLSSFETGIYAGATRLASFILLFTYAVSSVLNNRVSRYTEPKQLQSYLLKSLSIVALAIVGFVVFLPLARWIIYFTIGAEYLSGLLPFIVLVANALLGLALVPYTSYFFAVDAPSYHSVGGILQVAIILLGNWLFLNDYGLMAAASIRLVATLVFALYTLGMMWWSWGKIGVRGD